MKYYPKIITSICLLLTCSATTFAQDVKQQVADSNAKSQGMKKDIKQDLAVVPDSKDSVKFSIHGTPSATFSQTSYSESWQDGTNSLGFRVAFIGSAIYKQDRKFIKNSLDLAYARSREGDADVFVKKEDRLNYNFAFGYEVTSSSPFYWVGQLDLKTQFDKGVSSDGATVSKFFAPAYIITSLGTRYESTFGLSAVLAPVSGRFTIVSDTSYCQYVDVDMAANPRNFKAQLGAYAQIAYDKKINGYISIRSTLDLFSIYNDNPQNIGIEWITTVHFQLNKFFSLIFFNRLVYRDKDRYTAKETINGIETDVMKGPKIQWNESLNVGFAYSF
ncbi:MAG: DUF3078 domain-containing protein [Prevotellaceae bacterium]|jgi:hypothetical protein|nr:DUF3078 domain-containing protein [Prevotellaceae bacterium]